MRELIELPNRNIYLILMISVAIAGCAYSGVYKKEMEYTIQPGDKVQYGIQNQSDMPESEFEIMKRRLDATLQEQNLVGQDANILLEITVVQFRFRSNTSRILLGNFQGNDAVTSNVVIRNIVDGSVLGKEQVIAHNPTVISKVKDLVETHADKIVNSLSN